MSSRRRSRAIRGCSSASQDPGKFPFGRGHLDTPGPIPKPCRAESLCVCRSLHLQFVTAYEQEAGRLEMASKASKTLVEKAAEKFGYGLAMAEDVAGSVKTALGSVAGALTKSASASEVPVKKAAQKKSAPNPASKSAAPIPPAKKSAAKKSPAKKSPAKKPAQKKAVKKAAKKASRKTSPTRR